MKDTNFYDVVIIGGGIAGMTAAIYVARANHSCIVLESNITGGLANSTYIVENYPSYTAVHGMELMQKVRNQVDALGVSVEEVCEITAVNLTDTVKTIKTDDAMYAAKAVIIATGRTPVPLEVPTECEQIHHCAICDGAGYKNKNVIIVGSGNSAFDEGLYLLQLGIANATMVESQNRLFAAECTQQQFFNYTNVVAHTNTVVEDVIVENGELTKAILLNTENQQRTELATEGIFVFLGQRPNSELFKGTITLDKAGYICADENMATNVAGVFSAGDINAKQFRQLTTAAADGTIAALMADKYIRSLSCTV